MDDNMERILQLSRATVILPTLGVAVQVRALRSRDMLEAGLLPLTRIRPDEMPPEEIEGAERDMLEAARNLLVVCAISPRVFPAEHPAADAGALCIDDIPDEDVLAAYKQIVVLSDSRFYGTNHAAFNPDLHERLYRAQKEMALAIDDIARRYHISPLEVERWSADEISRITAYMEIAEAERKRRAAEAEDV